MATATSASIGINASPVLATTQNPQVTPDSSGLHQRMSVEKGVVDELLLVCGVIGTTAKDGEELVPVTDCLNWLQDLQRALRRDDDTYRPISLLIGNWKVVQQKLIPLIMTCRYDTPMVLTIVKILVILTKPLSETTKRAGLMVINTQNKKKYPDQLIKEQIKLRENALAQSDMLMEYKHTMTHHSSHIQSRKNGVEGGLFSVFVSLLAEPLSKTGASRTNTDHLTIELVLHLFRNLLSAEPLLATSPDLSQKSKQLHQELTALFDSELVFEIIFVLAQEMESRENANYNLLLMEMLNYLLKNHDPTVIARSKKGPVLMMTNTGKENQSRSKCDVLRQALMKEKSKFLDVTPARHSHFGGTLVVHRSDGKRRYISAATLEQGNATVPLGANKRKNRKHEPFVGSSQKRGDDRSPTSLKAQQTLNKFCERFVKDCYGPMMKSLKNEFRRDSVRLEEGDKVVFFRIVWFLNQWWRVSGKKQLSASNTTILGQIIFSMDLFMFNLVLNAIDDFVENKKNAQLAGAVALFSEQMHLLHEMYRSKDKTEHSMSLGLLHQLFYKKMESIDRLPKLISKWAPGTSSREYLCDLVEVVHVSLKLLEANSTRCREPTKDRAVAKMQSAAEEFDVNSYIARKIITNNMIVMYTHLLAHYADNALHVNHHVIAFFLRVSKTKLFIPDEEDDDIIKNPLTTRTVTFQPMLYSVQMIFVLNTILNDMSIRKEKDYFSVLSFATHMMEKFSNTSKENALMYVEALFRHPLPARFCEMATNLYVNEELRMMAERELLMEEEKQMVDDDYESERETEMRDAIPAKANTLRDQSQFRDSDDEDEVEWGGADVEEGNIEHEMTKKRKRPIKNRKATVKSDSPSEKFESDIEASSSEDKGYRSGTNKKSDDNGGDAPSILNPLKQNLDTDPRSGKLQDASDDDDILFDAFGPGAASRKKFRAILNDDSDNE